LICVSPTPQTVPYPDTEEGLDALFAKHSENDSEYEEWIEARDKVLFEGWEIHRSMGFITDGDNKLPVEGMQYIAKTIEDLINSGIELIQIESFKEKK